MLSSDYNLATFAIVVACAASIAHPVHATISGITSDPEAASGKMFDYIIVGGGTAGTTVAARLAEDSTLTVLMVEVGGDNRTNPNVFNVFNDANLATSALDWAWPTDQGKVIHG